MKEAVNLDREFPGRYDLSLGSPLVSYHFQLFSYLYLLVFWKSLHLEVTSDLFCFLINTHHLLIFALIIILFIFTGFNIYCWTGIYFS